MERSCSYIVDETGYATLAAGTTVKVEHEEDLSENKKREIEKRVLSLIKESFYGQKKWGSFTFIFSKITVIVPDNSFL
jgi:hypothetical protein